MKTRIKPKVLFIVPLPPPVHGSSMMCQYIKDSELINSSFSCDYVNLSVSRSMSEVHSFRWIKIWRFLCAYLLVMWKLLTNRYALCYVALAFHKSLLKDAPFVLLCKLFRRKVVIHLHGKGASEDAKKSFYRWLLKLTFSNTKVIMLSWLLYPDVEQFVKREDVAICPNGIPELNKEVQRKIKENVVPRLIFLSNLIVSKGVLVLLDALKILKDKRYSFVCDFVGGETNEIDAKRFEDEVKVRKLNRLVIFHGKKYGDDKNQILEYSDIFVLPTSNDCFPLVLLEAMQNHLPCISTNIGGIKDVVKDGENGLICENNNPDSLANSIQRLLDEPKLRRKMGENGYEKYKETFTIGAFEVNLTSILQSI